MRTTSDREWPPLHDPTRQPDDQAVRKISNVKQSCFLVFAKSQWFPCFSGLARYAWLAHSRPDPSIPAALCHAFLFPHSLCHQKSAFEKVISLSSSFFPLLYCCSASKAMAVLGSEACFESVWFERQRFEEAETRYQHFLIGSTPCATEVCCSIDFSFSISFG